MAEPLLRADQALEMGNSKYLGYELEFMRCRCREQRFIVFCPLQNRFADCLPFQLKEYFARGNQAALYYEFIESVPNGFEDPWIKMLK